MKRPETAEDASGGSVRADFVRRGRHLEYLTIGWNSLEGLIAVGAGLAAGSIALVGFGFDSVIEVLSSAALLWRRHLDAPERRERAEGIALGLVGVSFLLLGRLRRLRRGESARSARAARGERIRDPHRRVVAGGDAASGEGETVRRG